MVKWLILFLSSFFLSLTCQGQATHAKRTIDCDNKQVQDSLIERYLDKGAEELPYLYNDPGWELYCDSVIALCPGIAYAYRQKAIPYIKNGEYEKAFAINNIAVQLDPKSWTAYRGFLKCIFTKDYEGAIRDFKKAEEFNAGGYEMDHTYFFYEGLCNLELGNYSKAEENMKKDIQIQTNGDPAKDIHFNTLFYLGVIYYESKNYSQAKKYLLKCLGDYPQHPDANYYLALTYKKENNEEFKNKYLQIAKESLKKKYGINEDNVYYANYPHQIKLYEIEQELIK